MQLKYFIPFKSFLCEISLEIEEWHFAFSLETWKLYPNACKVQGTGMILSFHMKISLIEDISPLESV